MSALPAATRADPLPLNPAPVVTAQDLVALLDSVEDVAAVAEQGALRVPHFPRSSMQLTRFAGKLPTSPRINARG